MNGVWLVIGMKEGREPIRLAFVSHRQAFHAADLMRDKGWFVTTKAVET